MSNIKPLIVILGPTASGKSELAVFLARKFNGEMVSADSRQVYKWMNIGTGKITKKEMRGVTHHLLDIAHPSRQFTVVQYQKKALRAIRDIQKRDKLPILVGGTGFYIQAAVDGIVFPQAPTNKKLRAQLEKLNAERLFEKLQKLDPLRALSIDSHNKRRLIRALEIIAATDKPVPPKAGSELALGVLMIGIAVSREELNEKIKKRLQERLRQGMIKEVKNLHEKHGLSWKRLENFGLEYRWIARFLQGGVSRTDMEKNLLRDIKHYAKRQMTWFKKDKRIKWLRNKKEAQKLVASFLKK